MVVINYYQILDLSQTGGNRPLTSGTLRQAYRTALLAHHPDKQLTNSPSPGVTIDDVALAYKTLSDPELRAEYDSWLQSADARGDNRGPAVTKPRHTGLETVDLDDLVFDESDETWSRSCRCGEARGFVIGTAELEKQVEEGEIIVGCRGCSLWLRILFGVEE